MDHGFDSRFLLRIMQVIPGLEYQLTLFSINSHLILNIRLEDYGPMRFLA